MIVFVYRLIAFHGDLKVLTTYVPYLHGLERRYYSSVQPCFYCHCPSR